MGGVWGGFGRGFEGGGGLETPKRPQTPPPETPNPGVWGGLEGFRGGLGGGWGGSTTRPPPLLLALPNPKPPSPP